MCNVSLAVAASKCITNGIRPKESSIAGEEVDDVASPAPSVAARVLRL